MKVLILSDIHSNLEALRAVMEDLEKRSAPGGIDQVWCLGDIVGYGPNPVECIELLRQYDPLCVAGNHDWAALGRIPLSDFNPYAAAACRWTTRQLGPGERDYLDNLPLTIMEGDFTLAHGSPQNPIWEYLLSEEVALSNFRSFDTACCLVGHSHIPLLFRLEKNGVCRGYRLMPEMPIVLGPAKGGRLIINPGGVGQPRDGDPRAAYAIYDSDRGTITPYRVSYDIATTQEKMAKQDLPKPLIERLSFGW